MTYLLLLWFMKKNPELMASLARILRKPQSVESMEGLDPK
jgi:hypothetical protein